ncbi:MAG: aromatic amino acid ammonia-lyase [Capnocytophaga sp.]|nr:aromatic amino acid ammonia-lyase [Capnocytophaga sp.]
MTLKISEFENIAFHRNPLEIKSSVWERTEQSFLFLENFSKDKIIYGVNTGFGPMAQYRIKDEDRIALQYNLIRSHASGVGEPLAPHHVRAAILARINTLSLGYSGVHPELIQLMNDLLTHDITPLIFSHGGVGASGDLVQLAHLALVLIGEGEVFYEGKRQPTADVFHKLKLKPFEIRLREGLALMNGTSVMTGIGISNTYYSKKLLEAAISCSCAINEIVRTYDDHFSEELNQSKLHAGQRYIAERMRSLLHDSQRIRKREEHLYTPENQETVFKDKVQEYYSLRCLPQILGPIADTLEYTEKVLENEINSASDNPISDVEKQHVFHGGNFHGDYISLEMDKLKIVITRLTMLAERQLNYLLNPKINELLPAFVNLGTLGFNFGMQGVQFTATSTTAENQVLANPMYVHSIPNNNDNQDIVSMGTNAALLTSKVIENAFEVLAIEMITIVQAIDALDCQSELSSHTQGWYAEVRKLVPRFEDDPVMYPLVQKVKDYLKDGK